MSTCIECESRVGAFEDPRDPPLGGRDDDLCAECAHAAVCVVLEDLISRQDELLQQKEHLESLLEG